MYNIVQPLVMMTTQCSGGCQHCPFSNPSLEKLFLTPTAVRHLVHENTRVKNLTILSGGEPFEHLKISEILTELIESVGPFRIATGGFVDLSPWIDQLVTLCHAKRSLQGISIGTDVLTSRVNHSNWVQFWINNIHLLSQYKIPFSITFSLPSNLNFSHFDVWNWSAFFGSLPEFIYLRYHREERIEEMIQKIRSVFGDLPVIYDSFDESDGPSPTD